MMTHMHAMSKQYHLGQQTLQLACQIHGILSGQIHAEMDNDEWYSLLVTNITPFKRMYSALVCCGVWCAVVCGVAWCKVGWCEIMW